jgi:ribonucleoside-diphosphate reductase alpha chain
VPATLTQNALAVLGARYLVREAGVVVETPEQLFRRVARHIAGVESKLGYSEAEVADATARFERMMSTLEFLPNSPTLMNAGRPLGQLAACFVVPVDDSTTGVFEAVRWAAEIQKTGGGTGFSFSRLRPAGDLVASTGGNASGPVALMQVFDVATEAIKQGGTRRGANMGMLRIDHPDILEFIALKLDPSRMVNFNLSVAVTDAFMTAVKNGTTYQLVNPRNGIVTAELDARRVFDAIANAAWTIGDPGMVFIDRINQLQPTPGLGPIEATNPCVTGDTRVWVEGTGLVPIRELVGTTPMIATWDAERVVFRRATQVIRTGVKTVFRLETVEGLTLRLTADHRVTTEHGDVAAGELRAGTRLRGNGEWWTVRGLTADGEEEVFDLTEPTTSHFFANGVLVHNCGEQPLLPFESCTLGSIDVGRFVAAHGQDFDWERLRTVIRDAVRFLDDVIDANRYPLPEIERATKATRKIGLGIMGWADALAALEIAYDAPPALELAERIARFLEDESLAASRDLAERRGAFPTWKGSRWETDGFPLERNDRNATGDDKMRRPLRNATTTTIAPTGTISIIAGCSSGIEPFYALAYTRNVLDGAHLTEVNPAFQRIAAEKGFGSDELFAAVAEHGGVRANEHVPEDVRRVFPTAHEIDVGTHVRMQAAFQRYVHAAVSKTINLPRSATPGDVKAAYQLAYESGCKGITVYRDGSRDGQVLVTGARRVQTDLSAHCPECGSVLIVQSSCRLCRHCGWSVCG